MSRPTLYTRLAVALMLLLSISSLHAQAVHWQSVNMPYGPAPMCTNRLGPYFLNEDYGFLYEPASTSILRTTDGGKNWQNLPFFWENSMLITQLEFVSDSHGYASAAAFNTTVGGLFETFDSGTTWHSLTPDNLNYTSVYATDQVLATVQSAAGSGVLNMSWDSGRTWNEATMPFPLTVCYITGNRESNLYASGIEGLASSTDFGHTWYPTSTTPTGIPGSPNFYGRWWQPVYAVPHSQVFIRTQLGKAGDTYSFTRGVGTSWNPTPVLEWETGGWVTGTECALYLCDAAEYAAAGLPNNQGLFRSLDLGATWQHIAGPEFIEFDDADYHNLFYLGHGAVLFAMDSYRELWKTTDGGDGALGTHVTVNGSASKTNKLTAFVGCDSLIFSFSMCIGTCVQTTLQHVRIDGLDSATNSEFVDYHIRHHPREACDSVFVTVHPRKAGTFPVTVHVLFDDDEGKHFDVPFALTFKVIPDTGRTLDISPPSVINFGVQPLCTAKRRSDTVAISSNHCGFTVIDSVVFYPRDANSTDFRFTRGKTFTLNQGEAQHKFPMSFLPIHDGPQLGYVVIYSAKEQDTIFVSGEGIKSSRTFAISADTIVVPPCGRGQGSITIQNTTCGVLMIDSLALPAEFSLPLASNGQPQIPFGIPSNDGEQIAFDFVPIPGVTSTGQSVMQVLAHMRYIAIGDTIVFDTLVNVTLYVAPGGGSVFIPAACPLGTTTVCSTSDTSFVLSSTGCDTLHISSIQLSAGNVFTLLDPIRDLAPGTSDTIRIHFASKVPGNYTDTVLLATSDGMKRILLTGVCRPGIHTITSSLASVNFHTTTVCEDRDSTVTLHNTGCDTLTILGMQCTGQGYSVNGALPAILQPGDSLTVRISSVSDTTGHPIIAAGTLTFQTTADNTLQPVTFTRSYEYPGSLHLQMQGTPSGTANDVAQFDLTMTGSAPATVTALHFDLAYDDNILTFQSETGANLTQSSSSGSGMTMKRSFTIRPITSGTVGQLRFRTTLSREEATPLTLSNITFDRTTTTPLDCIVSATDTGAEYHYLYSCQDRILYTYMTTGSYALRSFPNPAREWTAIPVHVALPTVNAESVTCSLRSETGATVAIEQLIASETGDYTFRFDTRTLPSGAYYYEIMLGNDHVIAKRALSVLR